MKDNGWPSWCQRPYLVTSLVLVLLLGLALVASYNDTYRIQLKSALIQVKQAQTNANFPVLRHEVPSCNESRQQKTKISEFRENFLLWDYVNQIHMRDKAARTGRGVVMYECNRFCGGWADQIKGTIFSYLVANLTGRTFKARYLKPRCGILNYIVPNRVNWFMNESFEIPENEMSTHKLLGQKRFKFNIKTSNFTEFFGLDSNDYKKYHSILFNLEGVSGLKKSEVYKNELSWMKNMSLADIYGIIYKRLFKLSPRLQNHLDKVLQEALPTPKHRLICIHVRLGHEAFGTDWARRNSVKNLPKIWSWIKSEIKSDFDKVFVTSDSDKVIASAYNQSFSDRLLTFSGSIIHSNKYMYDQKHLNQTSVCSGMERLFLEHHTLMNCDVLVRGHSGLSVIASSVRATDAGLYCLHDDGDILPCYRNDFSTFR